MIHSTPARRIAIVDIPRSQLNRLGRIRGQLGTVRSMDWTINPDSWAPTSVEPWLPAQPYLADGSIDTRPPTSALWMARIIAQQSANRAVTPGTLSYTPTAPAPAPVARWNSWAGPCPVSAAVNAAAASGAPAAASQAFPALIMIAAVLGAAASAAFLLNQMDR
jgi:hypothetical protein